MITIKFPKKPLTAQRKKGLSLAEGKFQIEEDDYYYIINSENLLALREFIEFTSYWKGIVSSINEKEIDYTYLNSLIYCITNKTPSSNLKWYGVLKFYSFEQDISEILESIQEESVHRFTINRLRDLNLIGKLLDDGKTYSIDKEKFKDMINESTIVIKSIHPSFDNSKIFEIIDKFPDSIKIIDRNESIEKGNESTKNAQLELDNLTEEEITSQIIDFVKEEFGEHFDRFDSNTIKHSLIPLFWDKKGIKKYKLSNELSFKIGKAEVIAIFSLENHIQGELSNKEIGEERGKEWVDWYIPMKWHKEVRELLIKIEGNTRKS